MRALPQWHQGACVKAATRGGVCSRIARRPNSAGVPYDDRALYIVEPIPFEGDVLAVLNMNADLHRIVDKYTSSPTMLQRHTSPTPFRELSTRSS